MYKRKNPYGLKRWLEDFSDRKDSVLLAPQPFLLHLQFCLTRRTFHSSFLLNLKTFNELAVNDIWTTTCPSVLLSFSCKPVTVSLMPHLPLHWISQAHRYTTAKTFPSNFFFYFFLRQGRNWLLVEMSHVPMCTDYDDPTIQIVIIRVIVI